MKHPIDSDEADFVAAFYSTLDVLKDPSSPPWNLKAWSESPDVQPLEAARILNGRSPTHKPADEDSHIIEMAALFVAHAGVVPKAFRLSDWVAIADSAELKHDEDIAAYLKFKAQENAAVMAVSQPSQEVHSSSAAIPSNSVADASSAIPGILDDDSTVAPSQKSKADSVHKERNWLSITAQYVVEVMRDYQCTTAKTLYRKLFELTGEASPFESGKEQNRGFLVVKGLNRRVSLKTFQNRWGEIKKMAA